MTVGKKRFSFGQVLLNVFFLLIVLTVAVPVINLAARSFASAKGALQMHGFSLWPSDPTLLNYQVVFSNRLILPSLWNNIVITVLGTAVNLLITLMAAYAVTRPRLVGKKFFMGFFIVMMLFNPGLMPEYLVVKQLKLIDSMWSVILVGAVNVYYLFILRRFIEEVPESLIEAARIDGASHLRILFSIVIPLAKTGIATIAMFYAVARWNEYFKAGLYLLSPDKTTLQVLIRKFVVQGDITDLIGFSNMMNKTELANVNYNSLKSAAIGVGVAPILLIYPFALKFYAKDVMEGGVKE